MAKAPKKTTTKAAPAKVETREEETTALAPKEEETTALQTSEYGNLMDNDQVDTRDLLLPRVLLMQGLSKFVADDKARMGEFRDSLEAKKLGGKDEPMSFIPFHSFKTWVIFKDTKGKLEYAETVPFTPDNMNWLREEVQGGVTVKRFQAINYYVLLPSEIEAGEAFPYVLSFRSTSYKAGRKLETFKVKYKAIGKPLAWRNFLLSTTLQENEKGKFYVMDVATGDVTKKEHLEAVSKWKDIISNANVRIDETDSEGEVGAATSEEDGGAYSDDAQY